jgi:catalase
MQVSRFLCLGALALAAAPAMGQEAQPEQLVDALNGVFGAHAKMRAAHTKGICIKGNFTPTAEAAGLSKSPVFAAPVPLVGRFSLGGGNPMASDSQKDNVRGIAMHFQLPDGSVSDLLMISAPIFTAKTPEQFLELLKTVAPGPDGKQNPDKIAAFFKANPDSAKQGAWLKARPTPASYATADYFGVHTFALINAKGERQPIKWKATPVGGFAGLSDAEAEGKGKDFYATELNERFARGPVSFDLFAVLGQPGDQDDDPTSEWPKDRKTVEMGTISITGLEPTESCDVGIFDPNVLADGVEASTNDKILPMRSLDYAVSFGRRTN